MSNVKLPTYRRHPLDVIFAPQSVAVIGATEKEGSVGRYLAVELDQPPFWGYRLSG